jgi:hypothetical protein
MTVVAVVFQSLTTSALAGSAWIANAQASAADSFTDLEIVDANMTGLLANCRVAGAANASQHAARTREGAPKMG